MARSARFPASSVPRSDSPRAFAASRVTPASASSGVMRNRVQPMLSVSSRRREGEEPGLQSVARAIGTFMRTQKIHRRQLRFPQRIESARQQNGHASAPCKRFDSCFIGEVFKMVGRERAIRSRQFWAPPRSESCSAWSLTGRFSCLSPCRTQPCNLSRAKMRSLRRTRRRRPQDLRVMGSFKRRQADVVEISVRAVLVFGGTAWAPRKLVRT